MNWYSVASEIFNSTAFIFADGELRKLMRNVITHPRSKKSTLVKSKENPTGKDKNSADEFLSGMDESRRKMELSHANLMAAFKVERAWQDAKRCGSGLEGLRNTLKERGIDL